MVSSSREPTDKGGPPGGSPPPVAKPGWSKSRLRDDALAQNAILPTQKAPVGRFSGSKYNLIRPKGPCGTLFRLKIQFYPPKAPLRDAFLAQNTIQIRLRACRRPSILSLVKPLRHQTLETPFRRFNKVPIPWGGPKGPREPKGTQGYLRAPWGGLAHGAPWGYTEAIPNGTRFD